MPSVTTNGGIFAHAFETKDLDALVALAASKGYETFGERATMTIESVGTMDTVIVKGVNGTLYQFYQIKE